MKKLIYLFLISLIVFGCGREELPPVIQVLPGDIHVEVIPNQIFEFTIHAFAEETELRNIVITIKRGQGITETILDTNVTGLTVDFYFHYPVSLNDDQAIMTFKVYNIDGESGSHLKRLYLSEDELPLTETQGYSLYSKYAVGAPNAFNIATSSFYQIPTNPDSTLIDLVEFDQTDDQVLSRTFTSWSGIEFVKNNAFNYAEATNEMAASSFESSTPVQVIGDLEVGDILITKYDLENSRYAVIKITAINESGNDEENNYTFNLKK